MYYFLSKYTGFISLGGYEGTGQYGRTRLNKILKFQQETETWTEIGTMKEAREAHAVSVVSYDDYAKWCK